MSSDYERMAGAYGRHRTPCSAEALPLDGASFDFAFCVNVVHHVKDRPALFTEASRVLDVGRTFCVVTESEAMIRAPFPHPEYFPDSITGDLAKAFSSLHFVPEAAFEAGLRRLKADLARGPMVAKGGFALLWATK